MSVSEFKNVKDILPILKKMKDPMTDLKTRIGPTELTVEEKKQDINIELQEEREKFNAVREMQVYSNLDNLYRLIEGQVSEACLGILENGDEFDDKGDECNMLWLLEILKEITLGLDAKAN